MDDEFFEELTRFGTWLAIRRTWTHSDHPKYMTSEVVLPAALVLATCQAMHAEALLHRPQLVQAVACFFPPTDFLNYGEKGKAQSGGEPLKLLAAFDFHEWDEKKSLFIRVTDEAKKREILRQISPITHVKKDSPPTFIMHGDKDVVVPLQQSETFIARLKEAGVPAKLVVKTGGAHPWPDFWRQDMSALANWFDEYLKGK